MAGTHHLLVFQLLRDVPRATTGYLDPGFGKEGTCGNHEGDIDSGVDWVEDGIFDGVRGRHIVRDAGRGHKLR